MPEIRFCILSTTIILYFFAAFAFAQQEQQGQSIEISGSPNPVGSGARAIGMGGAFIGVADDATAASWNPGGLVQLKMPEISIVGNIVQRIEDNIFYDNPEACGSQNINEEYINYLSVVYPFNILNRNMIVSLNYQNLYDFTREWNFSLNYSQDIGFGIIMTDENVNYRQKGNLTAIGLAYCIQIVPQFSLGLTLNIWDNDLTENKWESNLKNTGKTVSPFGGGGFSTTFEHNITDTYEFSGVNAVIGFLWRLTENLTIGGVFKTPFTADLKHEYSVETSQNSMVITNIDASDDEKMDMPMSAGIGIAYRFSDRLTLSADISGTDWENLTKTDSQGTQTSLVTGKPLEESNVDSTIQIRCGAEYLFLNPEKTYVIPIRAGILYDPSPAQESPDDYYGLSLGSGITFGRLVFDISYQYRFGNNVGSSIISSYDFSQDVDEHMIYTSLIVHFE